MSNKLRETLEMTSVKLEAIARKLDGVGFLAISGNYARQAKADIEKVLGLPASAQAMCDVSPTPGKPNMQPIAVPAASEGQRVLERLKTIGERTLTFCINDESKQICQGLIDQIAIEIAVRTPQPAEITVREAFEKWKSPRPSTWEAYEAGWQAALACGAGASQPAAKEPS